MVRKSPFAVSRKMLSEVIELQAIPEDMARHQRTLARDYFTAAQTRLDGARRLFECRNFLASLILYRVSAMQLAKCYLVTQAAVFDARMIDELDVLDEHTVLDRLRAALPENHRLQSKLKPLATDGGPPAGLELDQLSNAEVRQRAEEMDDLCRELSVFAEPRSQQERRRVLMRRWAMVASITIVPALVFGAYKMTRPPNLALRKAVTSSGAAFGTKPEAAVDGKRYGAFGFHSEQSANPWLAIDLGAPYEIDHIDVFGRHDCCFEQSVPMVVESSLDNQTFSPIAQRDEPLEHAEAWAIAVPLVKARYVRVRTARESYLVLSEVEVQGRPVNN